MDLEDLEPRNRKPPPKNLDVMSIEALHEYIAELEAEIARVNDRGRYPSDHYPVTATLRLTPESASGGAAR